MVPDPRPSRRSGAAATPMLLLAFVVAVVIAFVLTSNREVSDGPVPVVWDKSACAFCAMHLVEPRFAAQLTTTDGTTHFYDDPGCLFLHVLELDAQQLEVHARWFHELEGEGWLEAAEVAFQRCENTPMDYGFGAVPAGSPGAVALEAAEREVLAR